MEESKSEENENENNEEIKVVCFDDLLLPIPDIIRTYPIEIQQNVYLYLKQLDERHRNAYRIAHDHLGQLFHITKSNGYLEWLKKK
jgi:hypothetical protein